MIIAEVFAGVQGKTGQAPGREVHHWANYVRLKESLELRVVGGWKKTCRKDHVCLSCSCSSVGLGLWSLLQTDYCATWTPKIWNNNTVLNVFIWMVNEFCADFLMCRWIQSAQCFPLCLSWRGERCREQWHHSTCRSLPQLYHGYRYQTQRKTVRLSGRSIAYVGWGSSKMQAKLFEAMCVVFPVIYARKAF